MNRTRQPLNDPPSRGANLRNVLLLLVPRTPKEVAFLLIGLSFRELAETIINVVVANPIWSVP
jgi:hypothetical protein